MRGDGGMTDITKLAKGRDCLIRVPGRCNRNPETTVFCHVRLPDLSGLGIKALDLFGAFECSDCHAIVDGQRGSWVEFPQDRRDLLLLDGTIRTQLILLNEGVILIPGYEPDAIPKIVPRVVA